MSEISGMIDDLQLINTVIIFVAFAIMFSLARSFMGWPVSMIHAAIPAALFFIGNAVKYIYDEYF